MKIALLKKRQVMVPTATGWIIILAIIGSPLVWWFCYSEAFFSLTERRPAEVLAVEGWIGTDGIRAAKTEFEQGGYEYIVTVGGPSGNPWDSQRWNYATEAAELFVRLGIPSARVIDAPAADFETHRTFGAAFVAGQALQKHQLHPANINVFTSGAHARRSRLVFSKAMPFPTTVGVISWIPPHYRDEPWWKSSNRALDLIKETTGYFYELLLNSGRRSNSTL